MIKGILSKLFKSYDNCPDQEIDFSRPHFDPARTIYDAFCLESKNRQNIGIKEWIINERTAVFNATCKWCNENGLISPSLKDIEHAESLAIGHSDYGAKWAYKIGDIIQSLNKK